MAWSAGVRPCVDTDARLDDERRRAKVLFDGGHRLGLALDVVAKDELDGPAAKLRGHANVDEFVDAGRLDRVRNPRVHLAVAVALVGAAGSDADA